MRRPTGAAPAVVAGRKELALTCCAAACVDCLQWMRQLPASIPTPCCDAPCTFCGWRRTPLAWPCWQHLTAGGSGSRQPCCWPGSCMPQRQLTGLRLPRWRSAAAGCCGTGGGLRPSAGGSARQRQPQTRLPAGGCWLSEWRHGGSACGMSAGVMSHMRQLCGCACTTCCRGESTGGLASGLAMYSTAAAHSLAGALQGVCLHQLRSCGCPE